VDRTLEEESIGMTEDRDKWRKYTSMVWPTLESRTAKIRTEQKGERQRRTARGCGAWVQAAPGGTC